MKWNVKRISGLILVVIGFILIIYAVHNIHQFSEATGLGNDMKNFFTHNPWWNPIIKFFGGTPQEKVTAYNSAVLASMIVGIVCVIAGFVLAICCRKKKKR